MFVLGMSIFGYSQYAAASQIAVEITESDLIEKTELGSAYNVKLKFENPSILLLTAGETDFFVIADDETIGEGELEPFTLPVLGNKDVKGTFHTSKNFDSKETPTVKISGVSKYDFLLTTIDVPFVFYPTEEQARKFIHQE
ncbi:MAG: hypothetical protein R3237_00315 [Nitrosopumilaceae archaeon]|nr:hypothetical protein [Nitrosopumilaceae archaeon]